MRGASAVPPAARQDPDQGAGRSPIEVPPEECRHKQRTLRPPAGENEHSVCSLKFAGSLAIAVDCPDLQSVLPSWHLTCAGIALCIGESLTKR